MAARRTRLWQGEEGELASSAAANNEEHLGTYASSLNRVREDVENEKQIYEGGYAGRQVFELVQNAADAARIAGVDGRIELFLSKTGSLYCANTGEPLTADGLTALQFNRLSPKTNQDVELIGRFGVGFKSLLAVTRSPAIFSRTGSVLFDSDRAEEEIRSRVPQVRQTPRMRLTFPVEPQDEFDADPELALLADWADTVVRLPIDEESRAFVEEELKDFPLEFLLFARHIKTITLRWDGGERKISAKEKDGVITLSDGQNRTRWRVFEASEELSAEAKVDVPTGYDPDRPVPMLWAVPVKGESNGRAWTFFPTDVEISLSGILNAPWKTTEDRTSVSSGPYNNELLKMASRLVADSLPILVDDVDQPGDIVDILPEEDEFRRHGWLEKTLAESIYEECSRSEAFCDSNGDRCLAEDLKLSGLEPHPKTGELWAEAPTVPPGWAHWTFFTESRRARMEELGALLPFRGNWLESLVDPQAPFPESSIHAVKVLADHELRDTNGRLSRTVPKETLWRHLKVVLTRSGTFRSPADDNLRMATESDAFDDITVDPLLLKDEEVAGYLEAIGVHHGIDAKAAALLVAKQLLDRRTRGSYVNQKDCETLWEHIRQAGLDELADDLFDILGVPIPVRCVDGSFRPTSEVLWPGAIVDEDGSGGPRATVDAKFHDGQKRTLKNKFGVVESPVMKSLRDATADARWIRQYETRGVNKFVAHLRRQNRRPRADYLAVGFPERFVWPLGAAWNLEGEASAKFTAAVIAENPLPEAGDVHHRSGGRHEFGTITHDAPEVWVLNRRPYRCVCGKYNSSRFEGVICERCGGEVKEGALIDTTMGLQPFHRAFYSINLHPRLYEVLPFFDLSEIEGVDAPYETAVYYEVRSDLDDNDLLEVVDAGRDETVERLVQQGRLWIPGNSTFPFDSVPGRLTTTGEWKTFQAYGCRCSRPREVRWDTASARDKHGTSCPDCGSPFTLHGPNDPEVRLSVTAFPEFIHDFQGEALLPVWSTELRDWLVEQTGVHNLDDGLKAEVSYENDADPVALDEILLTSMKFPESTSVPDCIVCSGLGFKLTSPSGVTELPRNVIRHGGVWYLDIDGELPELATAVADELWREFGVVTDPADSPWRQKLEQDLSEAGQSAEYNERVAAAVACDTVEEKLVALIGRDAVQEISADVRQVIDTAGDLDDFQLGRILVSRFGVSALKANNRHLPRGAPRQWFGNPRARAFVASVGLPPVYAGSPASDRPEIEEVDGPTRLPELHDYQEVIAEKIVKLVDAKKQGLVALPTGAGKTRVAVEGLIRAATDDDVWPVLWIAQSDELCEQAAETWRSVWRVFGQDDRLTISRLWSKNELQPVDGDHVVVASIQKLASIGKRPEGSFDLAPQVVVVDEAHRSNATSYTQLLRTLKPEVEDDAYTLLGLTATPFRGENEDETRRLVNRYGKNRLDLDLFGGDPLTELRRIKVLAEADHEILRTDFEIRLNDADRQHFEEFSVLPPWLEEQISLDASRTRTIVDRVLELPADWPVLVYCPSVKGADLVAAMLSLEGVEAQSISGDTPVDARRQAVKDFKSGAVRILTNYRVLTEGFDAPGARAVVISRPVFSTNLYQQIIGRGLRGPANGGKDECLIVDVADNFLHFDGQLAFHHFDYLWETPMQSAAHEEQDLAAMNTGSEEEDPTAMYSLADEEQDLAEWMAGQAGPGEDAIEYVLVDLIDLLGDLEDQADSD